MKVPPHLALMGPPGGGKTFQGQRVAAEEGVPFIDVSDLLETVATQNTPVGHQVADAMQHGDLVAPDLTGQVVDARLAQPDAQKGFVLAGYGRNLDDAKHLINWARTGNIHNLAFVGLAVPKAEVVKRMLARHRPDDKPDVIEHRVEVYHDKTLAVVNYLQQHGLYQEVDGTGDSQQITQRILSTLE